MKTILLVMDSLNRHYLNAYGDNRIKTPNLDRLVERGVVFDNHYAGSLPCMPARREMMTGRLNFLETPWGPIEPWDDCLPVELRRQKKVYSHMVTDHYHYFHSGGEAYHTLFDSWEFERGQESDAWHPLVKEQAVPEFRGRNRPQYWANRQFYNTEKEEEYPTPRCFMRAMEFLENNQKEDNWHLHLEVFDPHEPFVCPQKYRDMYDDTWQAPYHFDWPPYQAVTEGEDAVKHIQKSYAGVLTMADVWLGKFLDKMDEANLWEDTVLILTTDHGHLLGEHGYWAKNYMFDYQELVHIPMIVCTPDTAYTHRRVASLTATMDLMPTIMELHDTKLPEGVHGKSFLPLLKEEKKLHDAILYGYFGKDVNLFDGKYTYCRQPLADSVVYHHTLMPRSGADFWDRDLLKHAEFGCFLPCCHDVPHLRFPIQSHHHIDAPSYHLIYDIEHDPQQQRPVTDEELEQRLSEKMIELLERYDAPMSQFARLGFN